jgi:hypothetical protein
MEKLNKKILLVVIGFITIITSCSKSKKSDLGPSTDYGKMLFTESTGWKRISTFKPSVGLYAVTNNITPYDFNIVGSNVQLSFFLGNNLGGNLNFKGSYVVGGIADPLVTNIKNLYAYQDNVSPYAITYGTVFFKPETYDVENLIYLYTGNGGISNIILHNEAGKQLTTQISYNFGDLASNTKMLANGDIITGGVYNSTSLEVNYYTRATNSWNRQTPNALDQSYNIEYTPFKITDGSLLAFRLSYQKNPLKAFLAIADFVTTPQQPIANRFKEEHPEYAPTNYISHQFTPDEVIYTNSVKIVSYAVDNNSFTVVLREENNTTHNYTLSAYKWTKGEITFQKLYGSLPISKLLGNNLNRRDLIVCQPDGTVATLVKEGTNGNEMTYSLATCDAKGEHKYGSVVNNTYTRAVTLLSCLRYINGSYYAVASPALFSSDNAEGQHIDVVKLIP